MTEKKLHRFYIDTLPSLHEFDMLEERLVHQIMSVLKLKSGESFRLFTSGSDDVIVDILRMSKTSITVAKTGQSSALPQATLRLIACVSIVKGDTFELIVQKLTELGVATIVPLLSGRTVKQSVRHDRLESISREATEQSGQNRLVEINHPVSLVESFELYPFPSVVFDPRAQSMSIDVIPPTLVMYVGPEGGWSPKDEQFFATHPVTSIKLCDTMLRTETAAIVGAYELLK